MSSTFNRPLSRAALKAILVAVCTLPVIADAGAAGPWRASAGNTTGWSFLTPDERVEHQRRMRGFDTHQECTAYQAQHHVHMAQRAARAGVVLEPKVDSGCERLAVRRRGY
jgi:hypothetical protein